MAEGVNLRLWMALKQSGKTQTDVAKALGVSRNYVNRLVNGRTSLQQVRWGVLEALSRELGISVDEVLGLGPEPSGEPKATPGLAASVPSASSGTVGGGAWVRASNPAVPARDRAREPGA